MRPVKRLLSRQYDCLSLYKDDIEKIIEILQNNEGRISVRTEKYEYENPQDFQENNHQTRPTRMVILRWDPYVLITMQPWGTRVETYTDAPLGRGMFEAVCDVVRLHNKWYYPRQILHRMWWGFIASGLVWLCINSLDPWPLHTPPLRSLNGAVNMGILLAGLAIGVLKLGKTDIHMDVRRSEAPWLERQWVALIAPALIAAAAILASHYWPPPPP